jgi:photosystem II stability/assembly factor-like uncharacterized protein
MKVIAGTSKGVFSVDNGQAGQRLESRGVRELTCCAGRLFAGTGAGLFVSDDQGAGWQPAGLEATEVWQVRAAADGTLYAGTQPAGLYRSRDRGDSWEALESFTRAPGANDWCIPVDPPLPGRARALVIDQNNGDRIRVGVEVGGILCSEDAGESWQLVLPGDNPDLHMMTAHPERSDELYASTGYGRLDGVAEMIEGNAGVFRSTDGGRSWDYVWKGVTPRYSRPMCIDPRPPYPLTVASAPTAFSSYRDPDGAQAMLFRTEDGGANWRSLCDSDHSPCAANIHGLAPDPEHPGGVLIGTDTGEVWQVGDDAVWTLLGSGMPAVLSVLGMAD